VRADRTDDPRGGKRRRLTSRQMFVRSIGPASAGDEDLFHCAVGLGEHGRAAFEVLPHGLTGVEPMGTMRSRLPLPKQRA